jgi:pimeloyl-ACP methyl ester carboxylesterase
MHRTGPLILFAVALLAGPGQLPAFADIAGTWAGVLEVGAARLRIVFTISAAGEGAWSATMDSPDQGAKGIPCSAVSLSGKTVRIEVRSIRGFFKGDLDEAGGKMKGTWSQGGASFALLLERGTPAEARRPQTPVPPFPYRSQEVTIRNEVDKVSLGGTLTTPNGAGSFPAVLLVTGSGQQTRDEEIFGHRPFLVLADALTRRGIAVLRCDDRGIGASTGDPARSTSADFARDAEAELEWLRKAPSVDAGRVGLIGHSEGGLIASMIAAGSAEIAFIVLLAAPGVPGDELLVLQGAALARASGAAEAEIQKGSAVNRELYAIAKSEKDDEKASASMRKGLARAGMQKTQADAAISQLLSPWFRFFLSSDPRTYLERARCPVLALNGSRDLQVTAKENLAAIEAALKKAGNTRFVVRELPGLNHLFQAAGTGLVTEYGQIEQTMAPAVLQQVGDWILSVDKELSGKS